MVGVSRAREEWGVASKDDARSGRVRGRMEVKGDVWLIATPINPCLASSHLNVHTVIDAREEAVIKSYLLIINVFLVIYPSVPLFQGFNRSRSYEHYFWFFLR